MKLRSQARVWAALLLTAALSFTAVGAAEAAPHHGPQHAPGRIALPVGFQPEGIAIQGGTAYLGSRVSGDIYAVNLRTGRGSVISQGPGTPSLGLKVDGAQRLYVSGGSSGTGRVVSTRTGAVLRSYTFTTAPSFVNDVVLTQKTAWFTDSMQPQLYGVSTRPYGRQPAGGFTTLPLSGDWVQEAGVLNANGITQTPDHKALLVVQSNTGFLFRVDPRTGVARRVDLGGASLTNGDGMLLVGRTLYVVRNQLNQVAVLHLNAQGTRGTQVDTLTSPQLDVPTTVAAHRGDLYLPNARFGAVNPGGIDYAVIRLNR